MSANNADKFSSVKTLLGYQGAAESVVPTLIVSLLSCSRTSRVDLGLNFRL